ncbi:MAG: DUF190 domain-containing protein [Brevinematales bacterium]|nr:DUF190 domain-containing protein [Brevinematales bacterium]
MKLSGKALLLRIFIGESDKIKGKPVYEEIVIKAKELGIAGATVIRGIMGFGPTSRIHSAKILELSTDLPIVVEIVDTEDKINSLLPLIDELVEGKGGLITLEEVKVIRYIHGDNKNSK